MASETETEAHLIDSVSAVFKAQCAIAGYEVLIAGADRHGSYVWDAGRRIAGHVEYVTLALTLIDAPVEDGNDVPSSSQRGLCELEIWFTINDNGKYDRRRVVRGTCDNILEHASTLLLAVRRELHWVLVDAPHLHDIGSDMVVSASMAPATDTV